MSIINDSKSTSFSSSKNLINSLSNVFWILGGLPKKGDKIKLTRNSHSLKAFIYGNNKIFFNKNLKGKIKYENFGNLKDALKRIFKIIESKKFIKKTILFSPCAASFDNFKNFEDRGFYFNKIVKKYINGTH